MPEKALLAEHSSKDFHPNDEDAWTLNDTFFYRPKDTRLYQY
jgi:hypothetical protein